MKQSKKKQKLMPGRLFARFALIQSWLSESPELVKVLKMQLLFMTSDKSEILYDRARVASFIKSLRSKNGWEVKPITYADRARKILLDDYAGMGDGELLPLHPEVMKAGWGSIKACRKHFEALGSLWGKSIPGAHYAVMKIVKRKDAA